MMVAAGTLTGRPGLRSPKRPLSPLVAEKGMWQVRQDGMAGAQRVN
jgi:hypothetical protein